MARGGYVYRGITRRVPTSSGFAGDEPAGKDPDHAHVKPTLVVAGPVTGLHVGVHIGVLLGEHSEPY
jgi:hypothetical protein